VNSKKIPAQKFNEKDECASESTGISNSKNELQSNDEDSSDSNDACLEIDTEEEESCDENESKQIQSNEATLNHPQNNNRSNTSETLSLSTAHIGARPTDPTVIRYFVRMGQSFSSPDDMEEGQGEKLIKICDRLNMSEEQLNRLHKPNGTRTARAIIRACYPLHARMAALEEGIDDDLRQAVHDYVNMFHGMECLTEGKINESINNVFRSAKSQQKPDGKNESQQLVKECEQLNEDLAQLAQTSTDFVNESTSTVASSNDQSQHYSDDFSLPNFTYATMNESYESQHQENILSRSSNSLSRPIEKVDLATTLVALKNRHSLSAVCINDICSLLCVLKVPDAPRSWFQVKKALNKTCASILDRTMWWICPSCKKASDDKFTCSNLNCSWRFAPPASMPTYFYTFNIRDQLASVLATTSDMHLPKRTNATPHAILSMKDIIDGNYYRKLLNEESDDFLTLTMSTDGIQPFKSTEKSIWPVTFIINEIKRKKRFSFQNLILGGVWPGPTKPKRFEMSAVLETIILQLKQLEKGSYFECCSDAGYISRFLKVFLICACMDKPAQALVQNLPEPTAKFGCGRCEIRGMIMRTIKATRREEIEMIGSLNIFRRACLQLHDSTMNIQLQNYVENMLFGRGYYESSSSAPQTLHSIRSNNRISTLFSNKNLQFFRTIKIGRVRYTTADYSKSKAVDDSAVLFRIQHAIYFGLITAIFIDGDGEILLELWPLSDIKNLSIVANGQKIGVESIQEGKLHKNNNYYYVPVNDIIEKCVYWKKNSSTVCFFRYPNLEESS
ncbi:unnamed protein product, partial [Rotaria sp. Silwood1]